MAPPYNEERKNVSGEDKFEAATIAFFVILIIIGVIMGVGSILVMLWQAGFWNFIVIFGILTGLFAIGRAIYHAILEKDFN